MSDDDETVLGDATKFEHSIYIVNLMISVLFVILVVTSRGIGLNEAILGVFGGAVVIVLDFAALVALSATRAVPSKDGTYKQRVRMNARRCSCCDCLKPNKADAMMTLVTMKITANARNPSKLKPMIFSFAAAE